MNKKILIYGIMGQYGSYLTKLLLEKSYLVFGVFRHKIKKIVFINDLIEIIL